MNGKRKRVTLLVLLAGWVCSPVMAQVQTRYADASPDPATSFINNYLAQDEQVNLTPGDGVIKVLRTDEKVNVNEYVPYLIPIKNANVRELRQIARDICAMEGGFAEVVRDKVKKQYFVAISVPPFMVSSVEQAITALDQDWVDDTIDGSALIVYQAKNRDIREVDRLVQRVIEGESVFDTLDNSVSYISWPTYAGAYENIAQAVDIPANEIHVSGEFTEIAKNDDLKVGLDYIAWKNGPGNNLFEFLIAGLENVERYRGASSFYNPLTPQPNGNEIADTLRGNSVRIETNGRQRYAGYNVWITAAYIDFLKSKGEATVIATPQIQTISGVQATWASATPVVGFAVTGSNQRVPYNQDGLTVLALLVEFAQALRIDPNVLAQVLGAETLDEIIDIVGEETLGEMAAILLANQWNPRAVAELLGTGDLGIWDRQLNYDRLGQVGAFLTILPHVGLESTEMAITASISNVTGYTPQGTPMIADRTISSNVRVSDGDQLVLTGLKRTEKIKQKSGMPFLSDIPYLGLLFGNETSVDHTTEVVIKLDVQTTVGTARMEFSEEMLNVVAQVDDEDIDSLDAMMPKNPFGFDQLLLDPHKGK